MSLKTCEKLSLGAKRLGLDESSVGSEERRPGSERISEPADIDLIFGACGRSRSLRCNALPRDILNLKYRDPATGHAQGSKAAHVGLTVILPRAQQTAKERNALRLVLDLRASLLCSAAVLPELILAFSYEVSFVRASVATRISIVAATSGREWRDTFGHSIE